MAAIRSALRRVADGRHTGSVVARGIRATPSDVTLSYPGWWALPHYAVIAMDSDDGLYTCHDPGEPDDSAYVVTDGTVRISRSVLTGDKVTLVIKGNNLAVWEPTQFKHRGLEKMAKGKRSFGFFDPGTLWLDQYEVGSRLCVVKSFAEHVLIYDMEACQIYPMDKRALELRCSPLGESWGLLTSVPAASVTRKEDDGESQ